MFNGIHHYVGTEPIVPTFKSKVDDILSSLGEARSLATVLTKATKNKNVKGTLASLSETISKQQYSILQLFKPEVKENEIHPQKKPRYDSIEKGLHVREVDVKTTLSKLHCNCGHLSGSKQELKQHKKEKHPKGYKNRWTCSICSDVCGMGKTLKRHYISKHMHKFKFLCLYCDFGRNERHLVQSHMVKDHTKVSCFPCRKEQCQFTPRKIFPTPIHRDRHEVYCGTPKDNICQFCEKGFKREKNMRIHINNIHLYSSNKGYFCAHCNRRFEGLPEYKGHYKNGLCLSCPIEEPDEEDEILGEDYHKENEEESSESSEKESESEEEDK